jgi:ABC-type amino acid transport substrate-binding protein
MTASPISNLKPLGLVVCIILLVPGLSACGRTDDTWDRVLETGVLRVGMDASFLPFESIATDGTLVGFEVDLARELGQRMGVETQFVPNLPYDGLYDALAVNRVDVVISALVVNPARMADFAYSASYFDAGQVLVVREGESSIEEITDGSTELAEVLGGCTLAVEFGTQGDMEARKWARRLPDLTIAPYQTAAEALAAVTAGEADAALVDHVSALAVVGEGSGLVIAGEPVVGEPYAVAVRKESQHLLRAINEALAEMEADGTMETLVEQWMTTR